jgi:lupus La protein
MAKDPKPKWNGDVELIWKTKRDYVEQKAKDIESGKINPTKSRYQRGGRRDGVDSDDWKKRRENDQKDGFKDDRDRNGRGRGRGGRGRGRGGRGRGGRDGDDRGPRRDHDGPRPVSDLPKDIPRTQQGVPVVASAEAVKVPEGYVTKPKTVPASEANGESKKRSREDNGPSETPATKKEKVEGA